MDEQEFLATSELEGKKDGNSEARVDGTGLPKAFCEGQAVSRLGDGLSASQAFCVLSFHLPSAANIKNQFKKEKEKKCFIQQKKKIFITFLK